MRRLDCFAATATAGLVPADHLESLLSDPNEHTVEDVELADDVIAALISAEEVLKDAARVEEDPGNVDLGGFNFLRDGGGSSGGSGDGTSVSAAAAAAADGGVDAASNGSRAGRGRKKKAGTAQCEPRGPHARCDGT